MYKLSKNLIEREIDGGEREREREREQMRDCKRWTTK